MTMVKKKKLPVKTLAVTPSPVGEQRQQQQRPEPDSQPYTSARDEEPVDAEWWEEEPQPETGPGFKDRFDRASENFATRARQRWENREQQRRQSQERAQTKLDADQALSEQESATLLRADIDNAGKRYMDALKRSNVLVPGFNDEQRKDEMGGMHQMHAQMMVQSCLRPLQRGASVNSVATVASTMATMWMMSPAFRGQVGDHFPKVRQGLEDRLDAKAEKKMSWAEKRVGKANRRVEKQNERIRKVNELRVNAGMDPRPLKGAVDAADLVGKRWRERYENIQVREHGRFEPYTAHSAGLTEIALLEDAFEKMREPGADVRGIKTNHRAMVAYLYHQAAADGLDKAEVARSSQQILGQRIMEDPRLQTMVTGLAHGGVRMSDPHEEAVAGTDRKVWVWSGEFEDVHGEQIDMTRFQDPIMGTGVQGGFGLRSPMSASAHRAQIGQTMAQSMAAAADAGDMEAFNSDLAAYMLGYQAKAKDFDGEGLGHKMPQRLAASRTMLASMTTDGIDEVDQRLIYSHAYTDAIEAIGEHYPDFQQQWEASYGQGWREFMHEAVAGPEAAQEALLTWQHGGGSRMTDFGEARQSKQRGERRQGSAPRSGPRRFQAEESSETNERDRSNTEPEYA